MAMGKVYFLNLEHKLFNPDHAHLGSFDYPQIVVMWAKSEFQKQGRFVVGQKLKRSLSMLVGGRKNDRNNSFINGSMICPII